MQKRVHFITILLLSFLVSPAAFSQLLSPADFLGYELGERFTPHHRVLAYVNHVVENSGWVTLHPYGKTHQHRELVYLVLTHPENHRQIDEIRLNNLKLTGLEPGEPGPNQKAIVWLSYNIHGNETSSSEAAMRTLHELVRPDNPAPKEWLTNSVVIMDPMLNPDGRDRYINWYHEMLGVEYNPLFDAREHHERWPGGRSNHYLFDLNRDWAWQVQIESQQRHKAYQQWMPHIHVDFHEQRYTSPYYFAPAAEPFHLTITDWQREFQTTIGENHMRYFDEEGWLYFTREVFDLFYPSFGDTWPSFHGSVGMTYEQAGHSLAGLGIHKPEGDTLTLKDRLLHHHTTGMSTVEVTSRHAERVIEEFRNYFESWIRDPDSRYNTFVVKADNNPDKIYHLLSYLENQQIRFGRAGSGRTTEGFNFATGETERVSIEPDDIVISTAQPLGRLVRVLFEPNPELADSLTYDITSWEAHYRFGLQGYALETGTNPGQSLSSADFRTHEMTGAERPYAWVVRWQSMDDARFLAELTRRNVKSRFSTVPFQIDGEEYQKGTLIITRDNNHHLGDSFDEIVRVTAEKHSRSIHGASTGFVTTGSDFGSGNIRFIEKPEIGVLIGEGTSSLGAGEVWHFFDHQLNYPATMINTSHLMRADLNQFNVLVLPSGSYDDVLTDDAIEKISTWTRDGGTLIAIGQTNRIFSEKNGFGIQQKFVNNGADKRDPDDKLQPYGERIRRELSSTTPGATVSVTLDTTHPLAFGYEHSYISLIQGADPFEYLDSGWNVGSLQVNAHRSGFVGHKALDRLEYSLVFGVESHESGQVVYMIDNPLFRGFWENGKLLFVNALFFVGTER